MPLDPGDISQENSSSPQPYSNYSFKPFPANKRNKIKLNLNILNGSGRNFLKGSNLKHSRTTDVRFVNKMA